MRRFLSKQLLVSAVGYLYDQVIAHLPAHFDPADNRKFSARTDKSRQKQSALIAVTTHHHEKPPYFRRLSTACPCDYAFAQRGWGACGRGCSHYPFLCCSRRPVGLRRDVSILRHWSTPRRALRAISTTRRKSRGRASWA